MTILVDENTRVICQGMTGRAGTHYSAVMLEYGTKIVGGVRPGKGGTRHLSLPVYDIVAEAMAETGANASMVFAPPANAAAAIIEAIEAEMPLVVALTERVPVHDMLRVRDALKQSSTILIGPNTQGILAPEVCKIGVMATGNARRGNIGILSRSASLTSEVTAQVTAAGLGQSTTVGIGGDVIHGLGMRACFEMFLADADTRGVVVVGEIGGSEEEELADFIAESKPDMPVVALVVGRHAPPERRMGHAGAIAQDATGEAESKIRTLREAGVIIAESPHLVGETIREAMLVTQ
ncbi:succinate--CoA ligase subunit alpha [Chelativorans sp. M5D2P16]|uniref:succinate--CoA ligase subunit alpha n=1 Tax=Chelativorans sp. M5D2P16 TaxID=3095678 RepID=UPI002ACA505E|nr:succinate--CoA ligase subunit alpha [Chelativorans sp. M5D2P16]MDZ5698764.1 succinate--CoA ligase subunit alpha [Chelativorans sp. M5D2P16]